MLTLTINKKACIRCGKCVRICPASILYQNSRNDEVLVHNLDTCIQCGHCVAICPMDAVEHSTFPSDKVHAIERSLLPTPEQVTTLIRSRRSNRAFSSKPVPKEYLEQIIEAAYRCPTASNSQDVEFTVITNPEKLREISALTIDVFSSMLKKVNIIKPVVKLVAPEVVGMIPSLKKMLNQFENGKDPILRGAQAVILFHTAEKARFGRQDSNLAYQNASLMAESLGVAQFYTGFVCVSADIDGKEQRLAKALGISGKIHAGMALGIPSFTFNKYIDKKPVRVQWI